MSEKKAPAQVRFERLEGIKLGLAQGLSQVEIARRLKITKQAVSLAAKKLRENDDGGKLVITAPRRSPIEEATLGTLVDRQQMREAILSECRRMKSAFLPFALGSPEDGIEPSIKAADTVLKIQATERALYALDAPQRFEVQETADASLQITFKHETGPQVETEVIEGASYEVLPDESDAPTST